MSGWAAFVESLTKISRPLAFAILVASTIAYFAPLEVAADLGFRSITTLRFVTIGLQLACVGIVIWPILDDGWLRQRKRIALSNAHSAMRRNAVALSDDARFVLALMIHTARDVLWYPMAIESCLEIERAGFLRRTATANDVAQLMWTAEADDWRRKDHAWAIANLPIESDARVRVLKLVAGCEDKFHDRI